jgi:spore coat protein U-like protein
MLKHKFNARTLMAAGAAAFAIGAVTSTDAATTQTSNLSVTASVTANCTITTAPVAFGAYDPITANATAPLNGTGTVNVTCTSGASTTVTLGQGSNADTGSSAAAPARRLKDAGTDFLTYKLYSESTRSTVWGDTAGTGLAYAGLGTTSGLTVYGAIDAGQNVPSGSYSDTVVATVTF